MTDDKRRRELEAARARLRERDDVRAWIKRTADDAPPLTPEQRAKLARLLRPAR